ncbi:hypothetical protein Tco_0265488 [Tanacetum coccineum]
MLSMQNKNDFASTINKKGRVSNKTNFQDVSSNDINKWKSSSSTRFKTPFETPSFKNQWNIKRNFKSPLIPRELFSNETLVMAAPVISISSDLSDERVGSFIPRVFLIGSIPVEVLVTSEVGAAAVASPVGVLELDTHLSSEVDPSESSLPPVPVAPMVSPFLCSNDSESDTKMPERHVSSTPHDAMLARWRIRVASRSSSPTTSTPEILTAPIPPAPSVIVAPSTDIISSVDAPPDRFTSGSSSDHSSFDQPSANHSIADHTSGHPTSDQSLSRHSSPPLPLDMRPRLWLQSPVAGTCFSSTVEGSPSDSPATTLDRHLHSPSHYAGPSHKRCRSPATTVPSSIPASGALVPTCVLADIEADATVVEVATDMDVEARVDAGIGMEVDVGVDIEDEVEGKAKSSDRGTIEVGVDVVVEIDIPDDIPLQRLEDIESGHRELGARSLIAGGERPGFLDHITTLERSNARL